MYYIIFSWTFFLYATLNPDNELEFNNIIGFRTFNKNLTKFTRFKLARSSSWRSVLDDVEVHWNLIYFFLVWEQILFESSFESSQQRTLMFFFSFHRTKICFNRSMVTCYMWNIGHIYHCFTQFIWRNQRVVSPKSHPQIEHAG